MTARIPGRAAIAAVLVAVLVALAFVFTGGGSTKTATLYFSQAISVYKGTDVDVMGVRIGQVTAIVPDGDRVRVDVEYDSKYKLPSDVKAVVITPTLVSDRFVQFAPAYTGGPALADGGSVPLSRTEVPVELDKIYGSLSDLTKALGPKGVNKDGALSDLLHASAKALKGNGELGNRTIARLSEAAETLGDNSGSIFGTVGNLARVTATLQANDKTVGTFMTKLSGVSKELAGERGDLRRALAALANALGIVRSFVHDNRHQVVEDVKQLTTTVGVLAKKRKTLAKVVQLAPLGLGNLTDAFDTRTGTVGIRLQALQTVSDLGNVLCGALETNGIPTNGAACKALKTVFGIVGKHLSEVGLGGDNGISLPGGNAARSMATTGADSFSDLVTGPTDRVGGEQ